MSSWVDGNRLRPNYDVPMDAATRASRYSAVLVERMWTMLEEEKTRVGGFYPLGVIVQANDLSFLAGGRDQGERGAQEEDERHGGNGCQLDC